jgi:hypothetical protein
LDIEIENRDFFIFYGILDGAYVVCTGVGTQGIRLFVGAGAFPYTDNERIFFPTRGRPPQ